MAKNSKSSNVVIDFLGAIALTFILQFLVLFIGFLVLSSAPPNVFKTMLWLALIAAPPVFVAIRFFYKSKKYKEMALFLLIELLLIAFAYSSGQIRFEPYT